MGNLAIAGMFVFLGGLFFSFYYLQKRHSLQKINRLMQHLADAFGLEFHARPFAGWNQRVNYSDVSGSINDRPVHGYVEVVGKGKREMSYFCVEMDCETDAFTTFSIHKRATFAKFAHQVFAHDSSDEADDLVRAKYVFDAIPSYKLDRLLNNEVLCETLLEVADLFNGEIHYHLGRVVYRETVVELDEWKVSQMDKVVRLLLTTAEQLENT
ncbi:hypothetical protein BKI52_06445 [marine bacterium AO1-C]|nr:hypothetical protein BKI52_06445 [marine bacterium AO1-C]